MLGTRCEGLFATAPYVQDLSPRSAELTEGCDVVWIKANTKLCPKCQNPIEKNGGCMHMTCRKPGGCGHEFCWICMKSWRDHRQCNACLGQAYAQVAGCGGPGALSNWVVREAGSLAAHCDGEPVQGSPPVVKS
eukprot:Skav218554  [mRNA]  locus=scaffold2599:268401:272231:- [translate_table: standard]